MPENKRKFDFSFRMAFAGNPGVGKTALMVRFTKGTFQERFCTVGISNDSKILTTDDGRHIQVCNCVILERLAIS